MYTFFMNYAYNSPFKDFVPPISDLWSQPLLFFEQWKNVIVLHEQDKGRKAYESRMRHVDDVAKRQYYMKMHNIETKDPVAMVFGRGKEKSEEELEAVVMGRDPPPKAEAPEPRKKWFGVF